MALPIILSALALTSCAPSATYVETNFNIPDQPANVKSAGGTIKLPKGDLTKKETQELIVALRRSELKNSRAVNSCKNYHNKLQSLYRAKKQP